MRSLSPAAPALAPSLFGTGGVASAEYAATHPQEIEEAGDVIALGLRESLDSFASENGAKTWKELAPDPTLWKDWFMGSMSNPNNRAIFNLDGVNVGAGIQRAASGMGGATDWELLMIRQNPQWLDRVQFMQNGQNVPSPF